MNSELSIMAIHINLARDSSFWNKGAKMEASESSKDIQLNIGFSCEVLIEIEGIRKRIKSRLIGIAPKSYLIVETPKSTGIRKLLLNDTPVLIRYVYSGKIYGFRSYIIGKVNVPRQITFLSYPESIEKINLRKHERLNCSIPATIGFNEVDLRGVISDLSRSGCRFNLKMDENFSGNPFQIEDIVKLSFPLVGKEDDQKIDGVVKNMNYNNDAISFGIEFDKTNIEALNKIDSYVGLVKNFNDE